ncbi:MAG: hypothetical protein ACYDDU_08295 [Dermatophilaceae bacterium]
MGELLFADSYTREDLRTYVNRARSLDADGAIRLQSHGMALAAYVGVLPGQGVMVAGAIIGLRVIALGRTADVDATVSLASVSERLARRGISAFSMPPSTVRVGWAALAPPRSGWRQVGELSVADLKAVATQGIAEIAQGAPEGSGAHAVAALRQRVWARDSQTTPPIPSGAAFAAYALGFLTAEGAQVFAQGHWTRLSTETGHVLMR